jgi:nucleoside 2-deoxyribosyltransferase
MIRRVFVSHSADVNEGLVRLIGEAARLAHFEVSRLETKTRQPSDLAATVFSEIQNSDVVIVILERATPNVFLELGYAIGARKDVLLLPDRKVPVPFEVASAPYTRLHGDHRRDIAAISLALSRFDLSTKEMLKVSSRERLTAAAGDPDVLAAITPQEFEALIADNLEEVGFRVEMATGDLSSGYDLVLNVPEQSGRILVETKKYSPQSRVSIEHVHRLAEAVQLSGAICGLLISSGEFTASALELSHRSGARLRLLSLNQFLNIRAAEDVLAMSQGIRAEGTSPSSTAGAFEAGRTDATTTE